MGMNDIICFKFMSSDLVVINGVGVINMLINYSCDVKLKASKCQRRQNFAMVTSHVSEMTWSLLCSRSGKVY